jgi:hypothetical protein
MFDASHKEAYTGRVSRCFPIPQQKAPAPWQAAEGMRRQESVPVSDISITPSDSSDNTPTNLNQQRLAQWIADIQQSPYATMFQPDEPNVSFDAVLAVIPQQLWSAALIWRDIEYRLAMHSMDVSGGIIDIFDACTTVEAVNQIELAVRRWLDLTLIDRPEADWVSHRARWRRDDILSGMNYREYLQSDHWRNMRLVALQRANFHCQVCNADTRLDVYHRTYERRGHELPDDLTVLCRSCHETFHKNGRLARGN